LRFLVTKSIYKYGKRTGSLLFINAFKRKTSMRLSTQSEFVIQCRLTLPQATQSRDLMLPPQYAKIKMEKKERNR